MSSLQRELNRFYSKILYKEYSIQEVTKGALSQARAKLKPEAFLELNQEGCSSFYEDAPYLLRFVVNMCWSISGPAGAYPAAKAIPT